MSGNKTSKAVTQLTQEIQDIRLRLAEAEATIHAIRHGEVDAILVQGILGTKVFSIESAETPYRLYIEQMSEGVATIHPDGTILYSNSQFANMLSLLPEKSIGTNIYQLFTEQEQPKVHDLLSTGKTQRCKGEVSFAKEGTESRYLHFSLFPLHFDDTTNICLIATDITDRRHAEEYIQHKNQELSVSNSEKDKFFSIIAHDLRGPFGSILGLTKLMAERLSDMSIDEIYKAVNVMKKSVSNLNLLIGNLMEWSLMNRGITTFQLETFLLLPTIHESILMVIEAAEHKKIDIEYDISGDLMISADINMIKVIMRNLVTNAVKFTPEGGKVQISAWASTENNICISVKDSGIGMNAGLIENLFRLDGNTSRKGTSGELSTGLGLIICKDFIEKHGGELYVESEVGKGSTFRFTLPIRQG